MKKSGQCVSSKIPLFLFFLAGLILSTENSSARAYSRYNVFSAGKVETSFASEDGSFMTEPDELRSLKKDGELCLTLEECVRLALEHNRDIHLVSESLVQADADLARSRSAMLPFLGAEAFYSRLDEELAFNLGPQSLTFMDRNLYRAGIVIRQPVFTGGRLRAAHRASKNVREARAWEKQSVEEEMVFQVTRAYWTAQVAEKFKRVAAEAVNLLQAHEHDVAVLVREGAAPELDLLRTRTELANSRKELNAAGNALDLALSALKNLMVVDLDKTLSLVSRLYKPHGPIENLHALTDLAIVRRPELLSLKSHREAAEQALKAAKGEYLPVVALEGRYEYMEGDVRDLEGDDHWTVGVIAQAPLWNWGDTRAKVRKAASQLEQVESQLRKVEDGIRLEVRRAFLSLGTAEKNIDAAEAALETAKEAYRMAGAGYQAGVGTNTEVLEARTALSRAEANHAQALFEYNIAAAALMRAVGPAEGNDVYPVKKKGQSR